MPFGRRGDPSDLGGVVEHDGADAGLDRAVDLGERLVVAVEPHAGGVDSGGPGHGELAAGADVDGHARLGHPAGDLGGEERLGRVVDRRRRADAGRLALERADGLDRAGTGVVLVEDVERRAVRRHEVGDGDAAEHEFAVGGPLGRGRPDGRVEGVGVGRLVEPGGSQGVRGHADLGGSKDGERHQSLPTAEVRDGQGRGDMVATPEVRSRTPWCRCRSTRSAGRAT